jgi:hypothetical protein
MPPKHWLTYSGLHNVTSQKTYLFTTTAVITSNSTLYQGVTIQPSKLLLFCSKTNADMSNTLCQQRRILVLSRFQFTEKVATFSLSTKQNSYGYLVVSCLSSLSTF